MVFNIERILTDDKSFQFLDRRLNGLCETVQCSFANPMDTLVCIHAREDPVLPWVANNISGNICDLHAVNSISSHQFFVPCGWIVANNLCWITASANESCAPMQGSRPRL